MHPSERHLHLGEFNLILRVGGDVDLVIYMRSLLVLRRGGLLESYKPTKNESQAIGSTGATIHYFG